MDVTVHNGGQFQHPFPEHWNAFTYVIAGSGSVGGTAAEPQNALVLEKGDFVAATSNHEQVRCNGVERFRVPVSGFLGLGTENVCWLRTLCLCKRLACNARSKQFGSGLLGTVLQALWPCVLLVHNAFASTCSACYVHQHKAHCVNTVCFGSGPEIPARGRPAHWRANRAARTFCDEHAGRDPASICRLPERKAAEPRRQRLAVLETIIAYHR
jgi:hypothetical protein